MAGEGPTLKGVKALLEKGEWPKTLEQVDRYISEQLSARVPDRKGLAEAYNLRGAALSKMSRFKDSVESFESAIKICQSIEAREIEAESYRGIGYVQNTMGDPGAAEEHYEKALTMAREIKEPGLEIPILIEIGNVHNLAGRQEEALDRYQEAIDILVPDGPSDQLSRAYFNTGDSLIKLHRLGEAAEVLEKAIRVAEAIENMTRWAWATSILCLCNAKLERTGADRLRIEKAKSILNERNDLLGLAQATMTSGVMHAVNGNRDEAMTELEEAEVLARASHLEAMVGEVLLEKGRVHARFDETDEARDQLTEAKEIFEELGNSDMADGAQEEIDRLDGT